MSNRGLTGWRRREAKRETAARREARNPLTASCRETIAYWHAIDDSAPFVYFMQEESEPTYVKIGWATEPRERACELQTGNPRRLIVDIVLYSDYLGEQAIHALWSEQRVRGEWFEADQILGWARWVGALQRQQYEDTRNLAMARRLGDKMPSLWRSDRGGTTC